MKQRLSYTLATTALLLSSALLSISLFLLRYCAGWSIIEQSFIKSRSVFHRACLFEYTLRGERSASLWTESPGSLFDLPHTATGDSTAELTAHSPSHNPNIQHVTLSDSSTPTDRHWTFTLPYKPDPILHIPQSLDQHTTYSIQKKYLTPHSAHTDLQRTLFLPPFL